MKKQTNTTPATTAQDTLSSSPEERARVRSRPVLSAPNSELPTAPDSMLPAPSSELPTTPCSDLPAPSSDLPANSPWDRQPGESDKAFDAFTCYLDLGPTRSMRAVSDQTGQTLDAINKLSSRHRWRSRSAALQQHLIEVRRNQAKIEAETEKTNAAKSWKDRTSDFREREFQAVQKLLATAQQVLDQIQFQDPDKMNFSDACRAFNIASKIGRLTLGMKPDSTPFDDPESDPYMAGWEVALKKVYGRKNPDQNDDPTAEPEATPPNQTPPLPGSPKPSP